MNNNYEKPIVVNTNETFESVYAESGYVETPSANATVHWSNHNSGSLSCVSVNVSTGNVPGSYIKAVVTLPNCIVDIGDFSGGFTSVDINGNQVIFIREGFFNPNESFQFSINRAIFSETGDGHDTSVHQGSYLETGKVGGSEGLSVSVEVA